MAPLTPKGQPMFFCCKRWRSYKALHKHRASMPGCDDSRCSRCSICFEKVGYPNRKVHADSCRFIQACNQNKDADAFVNDIRVLPLHIKHLQAKLSRTFMWEGRNSALSFVRVGDWIMMSTTKDSVKDALKISTLTAEERAQLEHDAGRIMALARISAITTHSEGYKNRYHFEHIYALKTPRYFQATLGVQDNPYGARADRAFADEILGHVRAYMEAEIPQVEWLKPPAPCLEP